jgi:hypothetical protein
MLLVVTKLPIRATYIYIFVLTFIGQTI